MLPLFTSLMHFIFQLHMVKNFSVGSSLVGKEATQLHALLTVHELNNRGAVTITNRQTLREVVSLVTSKHVHLSFM
jgi:hypothetical protein